MGEFLDHRGVIIMGKRESKERLEKLVADFSQELADDPEGPAEESLLETARTIASVVQPKKPSEDFMNRVSSAIQERFMERVSIEKIQRIIGMAVTSENFRKSFFNDMVTACRSAGFFLNPKEMAALRNLKEDAIEEFSNSLDERITKFFSANMP